MKYKKLSTTLLATAVCAVCSCNSGKLADTSATLPTDSIVCAKQSGNTLECKITADYPSGSDTLAHSVAAYVSEEIGRLYLPAQNSEDTKKVKLYNGDLTDGNAVAEYYANGTIEYLKSEAQGMKEAGMKETPQMTYELEVRKIADNNRYVSYATTSYAFLGGAHGSATNYAVNIAKASGKVLTLAVDTLQTKAMQPILRKGILSYLHEQGDTTVTEKTLGDFLFIENGIIPLPAHTPYLADDGVHFVYQQYEIGPYAMGMVTFTVPYADIRPFLTKEAQSLL